MVAVTINVLWQVSPVYHVDKWTGAASLEEWITQVKALSV
jgi:hypothetical protein